jgi:hypothetical protein
MELNVIPPQPIASGDNMTQARAGSGRFSLVACATSVLAACGVFTSTAALADVAYTVGGTVSGLRGWGLTLSTNGQTVTVNAAGTFVFPTAVPSGVAYDVTVTRQPYTPNQRCEVTNGTGTVTDRPVSNIAVDCVSLSIVGSRPVAGATEVGRRESLVLNFSAPLVASTVAPNWVDLLSAPTGHRSLDLAVAGSQLTLTPRMQMLPGRTYTIEVRPGIRAVGGEGMADTVRVAFNTRDASWRGEQDIGPAGATFDPSIGSNGETFVTVWRQENSTLGLNRYSPATGWEGAALLRTHLFIDRPQVFVDAAGAANVIWEHNDKTIVSSRHTAQQGWGAIEFVQTGELGRPHHWRGGSDGAGNIIGVWRNEIDANTHSAYANRYVPGSGWGTPVQIEAPVGYVYDLDVTVDAAGNAMAYWQPSHNGQPRLMSRRYTPGGGWGPAEFANTDNGSVGSVPNMAMRAGKTAAVYGSGNGIVANTHNGSGWQWPELISRGLSGSSFWPRVAFDDGGNVFAVWVQRVSGQPEEVWGNARSAAGVWSSARRIAVSSERFTDLQLTFDARRNPMIVVNDVSASATRVLAGRFRSGIGWLVEPIDSAPASAHTPRIHADASGSALAVWVTRDLTKANVLE